MIWGILLSLAIIGVDQLTKFLVYGTATQKILGDFLWFESTLNTGVAFSMFKNNSFVFFIIAIIASIIILYLIISKKYFYKKLEKFSLGLILGGTISNAIDRIIFKGVRDFIYLKFINFAIFNVADMAITIGAILMCISIIFLRNEKNKNDGT